MSANAIAQLTKAACACAVVLAVKEQTAEAFKGTASGLGIPGQSLGKGDFFPGAGRRSGKIEATVWVCIDRLEVGRQTNDCLRNFVTVRI